MTSLVRSATTLLLILLPLSAAAGASDSEPTRALSQLWNKVDSDEFDAAIPLVDKALGTPVDDAAHLLAARALLGSERAVEAIEHLDILRKDTLSPWRPEAMRLYPDALVSVGKIRQAIREYERLLDRFSELPDEAAVRWHVAELQRESKRFKDEAQTLSNLVWEIPLSPYADKARERLEALATKKIKPRGRGYDEVFEHAQWLTRDRLFDLAEKDIVRLRKSARRSEARQKEIKGLYVRWLARQGRLKDAIDELGRRFRRHPEEDVNLGLILADALRRTDRVREGLAVLRRLERRTRAVSPLRFAQALLEEGHLKEARRMFRKAYRIPKRAKRTPHRWDIAWVDYRLGRTDQALEEFTAFARRNPRSARKAAYWQARTVMDAGRSKDAKGRFLRMVKADPDDFYGCLAFARLQELGAAPESFAKRLEESDVEPRPARVILPARDMTESPKKKRPEPTELEVVALRHGDQLPRLRRASTLMQMGRRDEAQRELRLMLAEVDAIRAKPFAARRLAGKLYSGFLDRRRAPLGPWGEDIRKLKQRLSKRERKAEEVRLKSLRDLPRTTWEDLRTAFAVVGDAWGIRRATFRLDWYSKGTPDADNQDYYEATNPLAFRDIVFREAKTQGVDPSFVWAIMRVESAYNETAHSSADARGLLQMLPRTATLVARDRKEPQPHPTELLRPDFNIRYGVWYLGQLLKRFQGQELYAAASYNAGPFRLAWRADRDQKLPFDVALEQIPRNRGREYAKKVLTYIGRYRRVYLKDEMTHIGQKVLPSVPGIDY